MSLQATGLISGLDVNSIIEDLITAESAPRRRIENREKVFTAQQGIIQNLNSNLVILQSRATSLADRTATLQKIVNSSDSNIATATATTAATRQTYNLEVSELATASRVQSEGQVSKPADLTRQVRIRLKENTNLGTNPFQAKIGDQGAFTIDSVTQNASGSAATITVRNGTVNPTTNGAQIIVHPTVRSIHGSIAANGSTTLGALGVTAAAGNFMINGQTVNVTGATTLAALIVDPAFAAANVVASLERDGPVIQRSNTAAGTVIATTTIVTNSVATGGLGVTGFFGTGAEFTVNGVGILINNGNDLGTIINRINASTANVTASIVQGRLVIASNGAAVADDVVVTDGSSNFATAMNLTAAPNAVRLQLRSNDAVATTATTVGTNATPITLQAGTSNFVSEMNFAPATLGSIAFAISAITPSDDTTNTYATRYVSTYDTYDQRQLTTPKQLSITKRITKLANEISDQTKPITATPINFSETDSNFISVTRLAAGTQTLISVSPDLLIDGNLANPLQSTTPVDKIGDTNTSATVDNGIGIGIGKFTINGTQFTVPSLSQSQVIHLSNLNGLTATDDLIANFGVTAGNFTINAVSITPAANTVNDFITAINGSAANVNAVLERGQIKLTSANTITLGGTDASNFLSVANFVLLNNSTIVSSQASKESTLGGLTSAAPLSSVGVTNGTFLINGQTFTITAGETINQLIGDINANSTTGVTASLSGDELKLTGPSTIALTAGSSNFVAQMNFTDLPSRGFDITPGTININNVLITIASGDTLRDALENINQNSTQVQRPDGTIGFGPGVIATLTTDGRIRFTSKEDKAISATDVTSNFLSQMAIAQTDATFQDVIDQINASATGVTATLVDTVRSAQETLANLTGESTLTLTDFVTTRSITINGQTFETSAATGIVTLQQLIDAINKNEDVGVIAMLTRDAGVAGVTRSQLQLVSQNGQPISITANTLEIDPDGPAGAAAPAALAFDPNENAFQLKILNTSMILGDENDTSDFFEKMGLTEILAMVDSGNLNFGGTDPNLTYPKATIRSGVKGLSPSQTISSVSGDIIDGTFDVNGNTVTLGNPATRTLGDIVNDINALPIVGIQAQINSQGQLEISVDNADLVNASGTLTNDTLTLANDLATTPAANDPDLSTKFFKGMGLKAVTVTEGDFAGLRIDPTIGTATVNGTAFTIDLNTTLSDIMADVNSSTFTNLKADFDVSDDKFTIATTTGSSTRITLGDATDTSNVLQALELSETTQITKIEGTRAKLVSFSTLGLLPNVLAQIKNGDTFSLNGTQVAILADGTSATMQDIVDAINRETSDTGVTASLNDPDISGSPVDGNLYLKRMTGTDIVLADGTISVEAQLRLRNSDVQIQDDSNQVNTNLINEVKSNSRLGAIDLAAALKDVRLNSGTIPDNGVFKINSEEIAFTEDDSLQNILDRINSSSAGVTAFYNALTDKLELVSNTTGSSLIKLEATTVETIRLDNTNVDAMASNDNTLVHRHKFDPATSPEFAFIGDNSGTGAAIGNGAITMYDTTNQLTPVQPPRIDSTNSPGMGEVVAKAIKDGETPRVGGLGFNIQNAAGAANNDAAVVDVNAGTTSLYAVNEGAATNDDASLRVRSITTDDSPVPAANRTLTFGNLGDRELSINPTIANVNAPTPTNHGFAVTISAGGTLNLTSAPQIKQFLRQPQGTAVGDEAIVAAVEVTDALGQVFAFKVLQNTANFALQTVDLDLGTFNPTTDLSGALTLNRAYYGTSVINLADTSGFLEGDIISAAQGGTTDIAWILVNGVTANTSIALTGVGTLPTEDGFLDTTTFTNPNINLRSGIATELSAANPLSVDDPLTGATTEIQIINSGVLPAVSPDPVQTSDLTVAANEIGIFAGSTGNNIRIEDTDTGYDSTVSSQTELFPYSD